MQRRVATVSANKIILSLEKSLLSTQLKLLDVMKPLLALKSRLTSKRDADYEEILRSAFKLWAEVFHSVTQTFEHFKQINARFLGLLNHPDNFSPVSRTNFLGGASLDS